MISFNSGSQYGVVCEADEDSFTYVSCDSSGWISWKNDMYRDDLDRYDTVYTRYLNMPEPDDVLSNGKDATKANVEDILDDLQDDRTFGDGKWWDLNDEYDSDVLGEYSGVRGFVNQISDKIFGDLEEQDVDDVEDMRVGDMIYNDYYKVYGIVVSVNYNKETYTFVSIDLDTGDDDEARIEWDFSGYFDDTSRIYTRYPEDADYDYSDRDDDTLSNGKTANESNVQSLLTSLRRDDEFGNGVEWTRSSYTSDVLGKGS